MDEEKRQRIDTQVRKAAYHIIEGKGATYYGVGSAIAKIIEVVLGNQRSILTVCTPQQEIAGVEDVTLSLPHLLGGEGVINRLQVPLEDEEFAKLRHSAEVIKSAIDSLEE